MASLRRSAKKSRGSVSRREFLRVGVGGLSVVGLTVGEQKAQARTRAKRSDHRSCIFIMMTGGPSQLETFDPKPDSVAENRGPLKAIATSVPGTFISEALPRLAERADKFTLVRSLYHTAAPIHETGQQLLLTGHLAQKSVRYPCFGSVAARTFGPRNGVAPFVVLPRSLSETGVAAYHGQEAGFLGSDFDPIVAETHLQLSEPVEDADDVTDTGMLLFAESQSVRQSYGETRFGRMLLLARQLVECGVRVVTVNLFDSLSEQVTWDCHARAPWAPTTLYDYRDVLCPQFDRALAALLDDLEARSLLDDTLVVAAGEMGRTPYLNECGGRDHWIDVSSALIAGGGVPGGTVIGQSDQTASMPVERPVHFAELTATVYRHLGLDLEMTLPIGDSDQTQIRLVDHGPIEELLV